MSPTKAWGRLMSLRGRARRTEYAAVLALAIVISLVLILSAPRADPAAGEPFDIADMDPITAVFFLFGATLQLFAAVRRLHDHGKSAWALLVLFLPYLGVAWFLYLMFKRGDRGWNGYGPDPREQAWGEDDAEPFDSRPSHWPRFPPPAL